MISVTADQHCRPAQDSVTITPMFLPISTTNLQQQQLIRLPDHNQLAAKFKQRRAMAGNLR